MTTSQKLALKLYRNWFRLLALVSPRFAARKAFKLFCTPPIRHRVDLPPVFQKAEALEFSFNGKMIRGYRWNHPSPKKLLLLHGFSSSITNFDAYVPPMIGKGFEVLAFDAPAHGRSDGKQINVLVYANLIKELCHRYGPVTSFIAHSLGGLSLSLALETMPHDESFKLALIAPAAETTTAMKHFYHLFQLDERMQKELNEVIRETGGHDSAWYSVARAVRQLKAQVLFLQDEGDQITPLSDLKPIIESGQPNLTFVLTKGLGHRRIYRDAESVKTVTGFF